MSDTDSNDSGRGRDEEDEEEDDGALKWKNSKEVAAKFFLWLHTASSFGSNVDRNSIDLTSVDRDQAHQIFEEFARQHPSLDTDATGRSRREKKQRRRLEALVMAVLKKQKLLRMKRYSDGVVVCSFARSDNTLAPLKERKTALDVLREKREILQTDKGGVQVLEEPTTNPKGPVIPMNKKVIVEFLMFTEDAQKITLTKIRLGGSQKKDFQVQTKLPCELAKTSTFRLSLRAKASGVYRANLLFTFENAQREEFTILRHVFLRSGDAEIYELLKPKSAYEKKKRRKMNKPKEPEHIVEPPPQAGRKFRYKGLKNYKVPLDVREMVESREIEETLAAPNYDTPKKEFPNVYSTFWQNLLYISELDAYENIEHYDIENATLQRKGSLFKLYVEGLAEGRPSVVRNDIVNCSWGKKLYRGRVVAVEMLDVLLEFHPSFRKKFDVTLDKVDLVRFTFSRTNFRTAHAGIIRAPTTMGQAMLMPKASHVRNIQSQQHQRVRRVLPPQYAWALQTLNEEQKNAVKQISEGTLRPLPYCIFGPPGTGKTTTVTEAVYQLAKRQKFKILLVAPSNDATDVLVEKLSPFFPPSEMVRVLPHTRSIDQVSSLVRPYVREGLESQDLLAEIMLVQIVVCTVSSAARLWCTGSGIKKGHFDVLCVDEAGQATEPEVMAVASTMKFNGRNPGQLILSGDPQQLGPVIMSDLCCKMGMNVSYMERLVKTSRAYGGTEDTTATIHYPPELITLLIRNYRSHPSILKLPNEMFYHNKLLACGDKLVTHSMTKWEHLPSKTGFPVVFHAVDGENAREGNSPSWFNPQEAEMVLHYIDLLVKHSKPPIGLDEIGVITPYARQSQKIRLALTTRGFNDLKVGSVETFQGQERRCIIISTVRSESDLLQHDLKFNLGFVANEKRFNVAVTRAKALLVVIGNPRVLQTDKKNWLPFLKYCRDNGSWMGQEWDEAAAGEEDDLLLEGASKEDEAAPKDEWEVVADEWEVEVPDAIG